MSKKKESAQKNDKKDMKIDTSLFPPVSFMLISKVMTYGKYKYKSWNWSQGMKYSRLFAATLRHLFAWWFGQNKDPESGMHHLAHAGCCLAMLLDQCWDNIEDPILDDRPEFQSDIYGEEAKKAILDHAINFTEDEKKAIKKWM